MRHIDASESSAINPRYSRSVNDVIDYIKRNPGEALSLDTLARIANLSPFHFHRVFTSVTGITAVELVLRLRLRRAAMRLAFDPRVSITAIAFAAGYANAESFSRAFRKSCGQSPREFRRSPAWQPWQVRMCLKHELLKPGLERVDMQVEIVDFPETLVAAVEHRGPEHLVYQSTQKLIEWRRANGIPPSMGNTYGIHYTDHATVAPEDYRLDLCVSVSRPVADNPQGVVTRTIPAGRCARVRNIGSRHELPGPRYLYGTWLPKSGEQLREYPIFFHYVTLGPGVKEEELVTDIYLPLK